MADEDDTLKTSTKVTMSKDSVPGSARVPKNMFPPEDVTLAVVLPVLNERGNLEKILPRLDRLAMTVPIKEVIFVDDGSTDGSLEFLRAQSERQWRFKIVLISRVEKLGQVNACIVGAKVANAQLVVFMDADLQHPPETIATLYSRIMNGGQVVSASRHMTTSEIHRTSYRGLISRGAMMISYALLSNTRSLTDPMSGFFLTWKRYVSDLSPLTNRCKLLLYVLATHADLQCIEVPYGFEERRSGSSKTVGPSPNFMIRFLVEILTYYKLSRKSVISNRPESS